MTVLFEYGSIDLDLSRHQAASLHKTGFVDVSPDDTGRWRITASSYVGSLVMGDLEILIRPKINPENLFLLLEPGLPRSAWREEAFEYGSSSDLLPAVVSFFARSAETTLGRGLLRSYQGRDESLLALRGRMDVARQFRQAGLVTPVACTYDDFTEDIPENQILKAAVRAASRVPRLRPEVRHRLMRQLIALESVTDTPVKSSAVDALHWNRLNEHYRPTLRLARLILANLTLTDTPGSTSASSFMVDMNDLFQRFMTERLRRALRGRLDVISEPTVHLGHGRAIAMNPDLVFQAPGGPVRHVGDLKYKISSGARARSADYYQLLAYITALDLQTGTLIYCGSEHQRSVQVRHSDKKLVVQTIDLTTDPDQVEQQMADLAQSIIDRSSAVG
ncbi:MAG TPA: McrC family protein [Corynebacterium pollutisoli]|uniref:5-methylcytosine-specific restriction enzyme subunit McrC n=1 Tax=Corynebacterium pollutisoli TaxID=1610489 RepID=A0A7X8MX03_9CORY|nr:hypothetical protein [Corynebacterium pollutisoli]HJD78761.1 McrC family protein [Corynebacterium pollutisoli]